jgi:hypothetical protein
MQKFTKLCQPAKLYLVVTVIIIVLALFSGISALTLLGKGLFALIWTLVLNWMCSKGFSALAWIIVLMPFIFFFLAMFMAMDMSGKEGFKAASKKTPPAVVLTCTKEGQTCVANKQFGFTGKCAKNLDCIPDKGSAPVNPFNPPKK